MEQSLRDRSTFAVWAGLHFPLRLAVHWPAPPDRPFDWTQAEEGRVYRLLWNHSGKYFYLELPYYKTAEAAAAGCPAQRFGAGESTAQVALNSSCWLPLTAGYAALNLHYVYTADLSAPPSDRNTGKVYLNWTQRWKQGDTVQLWTDGSSLMCYAVCDGKGGNGAARNVKLELVESGGWVL